MTLTGPHPTRRVSVGSERQRVGRPGGGTARGQGGRPGRRTQRACGVVPSRHRHRLLHHHFEAQADALPEAMAVESAHGSVRYGELDRRANQLARHLRAQGVARGTIVAVLLPRGADAYAAVLGILKAGAAFLPLDPGLPAERIAGILEDSGAPALVSAQVHADRYRGFDGVVVRLDAERSAIAARPSDRLPRHATESRARDLCCVLYTPFSGAPPRGVTIEHRSACHLATSMRYLFGVRPSDRILQGASLAYHGSLVEMWLALDAGAALVPAASAPETTGSDLPALLREAGVTVLTCAPTLLAVLPEELPAVRLIVLGGETCPDGIAARWARPGRRIVNVYGCRETTCIATQTDLSPGEPVSLGTPVAGCRVHLLDHSLTPVPRGETGEIWIGGACLARGYLGVPAETATRFPVDPFTQTGRMFRTGDLGRRRPDGKIELVGSVGSQARYRGLTVELSQIESALLESPGVRAAACAVHGGGTHAERLVGYVVPRSGALDLDALRSLVEARLPRSWLPIAIQSVGDLPRLPTGKLDRASLPAPGACPRP